MKHLFMARYHHFSGYKYTFPFLSVDCGLSVDDNYVQPLYKHCININRPTMVLIGLPYYVCASQMFDLQVRFCVTFLSGRKAMPTKEKMTEDTENEMEKRWAKGYKKRQAHMMGTDQVGGTANHLCVTTTKGPLFFILFSESILR